VIAVTTPELAVEMSGEAVLAIAAHCAERASPMLPDDAIEEAEDEDELDRALLRLTGREIEVLGKRFGLDGGDEKTLGEVGAPFRLSRERTRQIEAKALRKVRESLRRSRAEEARGATAEERRR
jgi:RNA polymerase primary sigma factor